jgi:hypothetical protein
MKISRYSLLPLIFLTVAVSAIALPHISSKFFSLSNSASASPPAQANESGIQAEEYAVYTVLIKEIGREEKNADRLLVIKEQPSPWISSIDDGKSDFYEEMKKDSPALLAETVNDLRAKNKESFKFTRNFDIDRQYVILSDEEFKTLFKAGGGGDGWKGFREKYPKATGITTFSRIGFNPDKTQALVYRGYQCGGLCGGGNYYLLSKKNGVWVIDGSVGPSWMS